MKKTTMKMLGTLTIAAALTMTTGLTACSSDNDLVETPNPEQPAQPTATGVKVTVTAGIGDGATTRSAVTTDGTTRTLTFTAGDRLYIHGEIWDNHPSSPDYDKSKEEVETILAGYLDIDGTSISGDGTTASFSGTLHTYDVYTGDEVAYDFHGGDPLAMCNYTDNEGYGEPAHAYLVHNGTMAGSYTIDGGVGFRYKPEDMFADDVETLMTKALFVMGRYDGSTGFTLSADCPILNCTLSGLKASHDYTATLASNTYSYYSNFTYDIHTGADGACAFAISTYLVGSMQRYITIKDGDDVVGTIDLGTKDMTAKVYNVSRVWTGLCFAKSVSGEVDLSEVTYNILAQNGTTLSGTLGAGYKVTIAAGATVTFSDMTIAPPNEYSSLECSGIDCAGNANIILDGKNVVEVNNRVDPGIFIPSGSTLTIQGTGSLTAIGGYVIGEDTGAGIGGKEGIACGNIVINSGTVTAYGNAGCAGIGSGQYASCDGITIIGGTVTATGGGGAAGIGGGDEGSCGNITIDGGTVEATGGQNAAGIGSGKEGSCGNITIATSITSVTAMQGRKVDGSADPIGKGVDAIGLGTVKFGGVTVFYREDWNGPYTDEDYGGLTLSITEVDVDEDPYSVDMRTVWTLSHETE